MRAHFYLAIAFLLGFVAAEGNALASSPSSGRRDPAVATIGRPALADAPTSEASTIETRLREQLADADRRHLILQASNEIEDKAYARFEIGMGGLGLLITILVIVFGFRTEKAAARAARAEIAERKKEIDALLKLARTSASAAEGAATRAAGHEGQTATIAAKAEESSRLIAKAAEVANQLSPTTTPAKPAHITDQERAAIEAGAREASRDREADLTADEFKARIAKAYIDKEWLEVVRLSRGMVFLHGQNVEGRSYAEFQIAYALGMLGRREEAVIAYDSFIRDNRNESSQKIRERVASAFLNKGYELGELGRSEEEIKEYDGIVEMFGVSGSLDIRESVVMAMINKAIVLSQRGDSEGAIEIYDTVIERLEEAEETRLRRLLAKSILSRANVFAKRDETDREEESLTKVISNFSPQESWEIAELIGKAIINLGCNCINDERWQEAVDCFDRALDVLSTHACGYVADSKATALLNKGGALGKLGQIDDSIKCLESIPEQFASDTNKDVKDAVVGSYFNKACIHACVGNTRLAVAALEEWREIRKGFDCDLLLSDDDFSSIMADPLFRAYLEERGCAATDDVSEP